MTGAPRNQALRSQRGVAMLEFVLMLPFIWIVLVLILNFGVGFLQRQRTMIAVREIGIRHTAQFATTRDAQMPPVAERVIAQNLRQRRMTAQVEERGDAGECPRAADAVDRGFVEDAFREFQGYFSFLSASRSYQITARGQDFIGPLLPQRAYSMCFAIDGNPWTAAETGGPFDWLKNLVGGIAGKIF